MASVQDRAANKVLQELCQNIFSNIIVGEIMYKLYAKSRLTTDDLAELESVTMGDTQKARKLFLRALADKGYSALSDFLDVLNETNQYSSHAELAHKLQSAYCQALQQNCEKLPISLPSSYAQYNQNEPQKNAWSQENDNNAHSRLPSRLPDIVVPLHTNSASTLISNSLSHSTTHSVPADDCVIKVPAGLGITKVSHLSSSINYTENLQEVESGRVSECRYIHVTMICWQLLYDWLNIQL